MSDSNLDLVTSLFVDANVSWVLKLTHEEPVNIYEQFYLDKYFLRTTVVYYSLLSINKKC